MDIFLLYLWTRLDVISTTSGMMSFAFSLALLFSFIFRTYPDDDDVAAAAKKAAKPLLRAAIACLILFAIVPTKKDAMFILAGSAVIDVARSETAGRLASKSVQLIEQTLDGYLKKPEGK